MKSNLEPRSVEHGSALVIAMLVTVVLTLLGVSFLLMAETENRIARNERRSAQAFYAAQSTVRVVKRWFDFPASGVAPPVLADVDRTRRRILDETDPYDPNDVTAADGVIGSAPYYKQGVDLDANALDDLFDRPYRGGMLHPFLGTEDGPDIVIDETNAASVAYLRTLEQTMLPGYPGDNLTVRIARIDLFAPPYVRSGSGWRRYGVVTVRVVARLFNVATQRVVAEREIRAVVSEIPYRGAYGPLHSCVGVTLTGAPMTPCPAYDYDDWKAVASSSERGVHYFSWDGTQFVEDGTGDSGTLQALTDGREGIFFFDTQDALPPRDDDVDAVFDNLTPAVTISGSWSFRGVLYVNAVGFGFSGATGVNRQVQASGELAIVMPVSLHGLLINQGTFEATGTGTLYGSVVAVSGVTQSVADGSQPVPRLIFDASIVDGFPPVGWNLPRVTVTGWVTERE